MAQEEKLVRSAQEEIRELERKLEEKKRALAGEGQPVAPEKEVFREVLREHIETVAPAALPPISHIPPALAPPVAPTSASAQEDELAALVEIALGRTIEEAVKIAQANSPYLMDALHDRLVDQYYEKLIALRKLPQL